MNKQHRAFTLWEVIIVIVIVGILAAWAAPLWAQSWDINKPVEMQDGVAQVLNIDRSHNIVNLRFYSNPAAGEFKDVSCYFDSEAAFLKNGRTAAFSDLGVGDRVVIEAGIFAKANRSCRQMILAADVPRSAAAAGAPSFGNTEAEVVSVNYSLNSISLRFAIAGEGSTYKIYTCFFDQDSYLENNGRPADWSQLKTGQWVAADSSRLNSSQRFCGPLKIIARPRGNVKQENTPDFGDGVAQTMAVDLVHQTVSLKAYTNGYQGQYSIVSCYLDEKSYLEKGGKKAALVELKEGEWVRYNPSISTSGQRSCGGLKVIPRPF